MSTDGGLTNGTAEKARSLIDGHCAVTEPIRRSKDKERLQYGDRRSGWNRARNEALKRAFFAGSRQSLSGRTTAQQQVRTGCIRKDWCVMRRVLRAACRTRSERNSLRCKWRRGSPSLVRFMRSISIAVTYRLRR
jgi:hypothetical protein